MAATVAVLAASGALFAAGVCVTTARAWHAGGQGQRAHQVAGA